MANDGTWCRFGSGVAKHEKTQALAERLGLPVYAAGGLLAFLWSWSIEHAEGENGSINDFSVRAIEKACAWDGKRGALVDALRVCGFLDGEPDSEHNPLRIHDWAAYNGAILEHRHKEAEKKRKQREREKLAALPSGDMPGGLSPVTVPGDVSGGTVPLPTVTVTDTDTATTTKDTIANVQTSLSIEDVRNHHHKLFCRAYLPKPDVTYWQEQGMSLEAIMLCINLAKKQNPLQGWESVELVRKIVKEKLKKRQLTVDAIIKDQE